jgi:hypothetical protein
VRTDVSENEQPRVKFEQPLDVRVMTIDGTQCVEARLIDISESEARIDLAGKAAELNEFFLLLTGFGGPVYRRCTRNWVNGRQMGVGFKRTDIGIRSPLVIPLELTDIAP